MVRSPPERCVQRAAEAGDGLGGPRPTDWAPPADGFEANPGRLVELMQLAEEPGSVTPAEIADVLNVDELPVEAGLDWPVGRD